MRVVVDMNQWIVLAMADGRLAGRRQEQLERTVLEGDDRFDDLLLAEEELLDAHARGELCTELHDRVSAVLESGDSRLRRRAAFSQAFVARLRELRLAS